MTDWVPPNVEYSPPKPGEPPLHAAARVGDADAVSALVNAGTPVDGLFEIQLDPGAQPEPATALMVAAGSNDGSTVETVGLLLELGASVEPGPFGVNALWYACGGLGWNYPPGGDSPRLAALLRAGANPNNARPRRSGGRPGVAALARVCSTGDPNRVEMLLAAGADHDPAGARPPFEVPLYQAVTSGSGPCVSLLLASGADPNPTFEQDQDPPIASATSIEVLEVLLQAGADPFAPCTFGKSIVESLSQQPIGIDERVGMLRLLIARGVDLDAVSRYTNPLAAAAMNADSDAVEALLKVGADPCSEPSPLGSACFLSFDEPHSRLERVIHLLVDAGADPNEQDENGLHPLHAALSPYSHGIGFASSDGISVAAAIALLGRGASIDITFPSTGYRPLHAAAAGTSDELVAVFLAAGADPTERSADGLTPADVAKQSLAALSGSRPTIETTRGMYADEATAERRLLQFQHQYDKQVERARRCVEILTSNPTPQRPPN